MLDSKPVGTGNKSEEQTKEDTPKKPVIDRKKLLEKLKNRIHKRKQSLPSCHPEKVTRKVHCDKSKKIEIPCTKPSINVQSVIEKPSPVSLHQIIPRSVEDMEGFRTNKQKSKVDTKVSTKVCLENI